MLFQFGQKDGGSDISSEFEESEDEEEQEDLNDSLVPSCSGRDRSEEFTTLLHTIENAICNLGGKVVPKLNWSAPIDATWILTQQALWCCNGDEVGCDILKIIHLNPASHIESHWPMSVWFHVETSKRIKKLMAESE